MLNTKLKSIDMVIAENNKFGKRAIIIGIVTIPIFIGILILIVGVISLIIAKIQDSTKDKKKQKYITKYKDLMKPIMDFLNQQYQQTNMCINFEYASPFIVTKLIQYMEYGRADILKEALNIYENEMAINIQQQQLQEIVNASKKTAEATTYLAYDTYVKNIANY